MFIIRSIVETYFQTLRADSEQDRIPSYSFVVPVVHTQLYKQDFLRVN